MLLRLLIILFCFTLINQVQAEDIKLNADKRVEYHQNEQKLVAIGNAVASKGSMSIKADKLVGFYSPKQKSKISRVEAYNSVTMKSDQMQASGQSMIYDINSDTVTLKGSPARIKTPDAELSSSGPIIFWISQQKAIAEKNVVAVDKQGNTVRADKMTAYFNKDTNGKLILNKIDISDNVKINAKDAEITSLSGTYYADEGKIKLFDKVIITQNGNILKGNSAETDLNTGISRILSGNNGRVSGVFKETKKEKNK